MGLFAIPLFICMIVVDSFLIHKDDIDENRWYEQKRRD